MSGYTMSFLRAKNEVKKHLTRFYFLPIDVMKNLSMRQMQSIYYDTIITSWTVGNIKKEMLIC